LPRAWPPAVAIVHVPAAKPAHFSQSAAFYTRKAPPHASARRCNHQRLPLACTGGCAWSGGAVGGPLRAHRRPQGRFHSANCQICTGARVKHAKSATARLCSPALAIKPNRAYLWIELQTGPRRIARRRKRWPCPRAWPPAGVIYHAPVAKSTRQGKTTRTKPPSACRSSLHQAAFTGGLQRCLRIVPRRNTWPCLCTWPASGGNTCIQYAHKAKCAL
jgi:hypothetical protein